MEPEINQQYGNRIRVRACGLCWHDGRLLMVNHTGLHKGDFWAPPGGGIEFGQTASETVTREFLEETGLQVRPGPYLFSCEFINPPLHALELFFEANYLLGEVKTGIDPETDLQLIREVRWMTSADLKMIPTENLHGIFKHCKNPEDLLKMKGLWSI